MPRKKQPSIAVKKALEQMQTTEETQSAYQPISVMLTEAQLNKLKEITLLGMNERFALNLAMRYAITYANKKKQPMDKLKGFPKKFGNRPIDVEPTADTIMMLTENDLMDKSKELVVFGLKVFHERLFNIK
ncbi:hypothetical protein PN36_15770 [Candidatus Thiomargarita nelsonii]|uniref:Uncharacterized protein n=1 Tax=Candidatus Thiomargarita nelsonii TaxID=1003181 RepID=A0A0A6P8Q2_9GAMM|nr:hypothetical protein PN36_15770 [Candidatus Thiomargarita nelsonii]